MARRLREVDKGPGERDRSHAVYSELIVYVINYYYRISYEE